MAAEIPADDVAYDSTVVNYDSVFMTYDFDATVIPGRRDKPKHVADYLGIGTSLYRR